MSGIAECLLSMGVSVSGSDMGASPTTEKLKQLGAKIYKGHQKENVEGATTIIYSSAIDPKNPEMVAAHEKNIPIMRRAEMLAELMRLKLGMAVAGTHGKTTTTSFLATILSEAGLDPTYIIGGVVTNLKGHAKIGKGEFLVAEADESDGSFLLLSPVMSVITNIDNDHLGQYGNEENLFKAFLEFANKIPFYGVCALCINDPKLREIRSLIKKPYVTYGMAVEGETPDFEARNISFKDFNSEYDLYYKGVFTTHISIKLPGNHYILNSLGAIALAFHLDIPFSKLASAIAKFEGVGRRFELLYHNDNVEIIDDYGHHPTEIMATLGALRKIRPDNKIRVIFEPHRFSRTHECWDQFIHCFKGADEVGLMPIYSAGESPVAGIDSSRLTQEINKIYPNLVKEIKDSEELIKLIPSNALENTSILVLGAGSIGKKVRDIIKTFKH
jgi:UDP-N-acetylmuramate--alanine ligase